MSGKEFWMFMLVVVMIQSILVFLVTYLKTFSVVSEQSIQNLINIIDFIIGWGLLIPLIAVFVRRLHDTNHSGWWILVPFYNLILVWFIEGTKGDNRYGPDPKN